MIFTGTNADTSKLIQFQGYFELRGEKKGRFVARIQYQLHDPSTLEITLRLLGSEKEQEETSSHLHNWRWNYIWLNSEDEHVPSVEVWGISSITFGKFEVSIVGTAIEVGISDTQLECEAKYIVEIELMPSGILGKDGIELKSYTGDIKRESIVKGDITLSSQLGSLQVERKFDYYESEEYGNRVIHSVERAAIFATVSIPKGNSLSNINNSLRSDLDDICSMLSLCYRQPVNYYEIHYLPDPEHSKDLQMVEALLRRKHTAPVGKIGEDELINTRNLVEGGLDNLLRSYCNFKNKDELKRAIRFLSASFRMVTVESSYFLAYSALESVVSAIDQGDRFLLASGKWDKVEKLLRKHLDEIAAREGFNDVVEQMKEKLAELRRAPSKDRIREVCKTLEVETRDLWPREGFDNGLGLATKARNDLFHSALCESPRDLYGHLVRVRILTERMILKALKWPDDHIWRWYDQELKWINVN